MGTLYIGGAQCVHAKLLNEEDWENFDDLTKDLATLAKKFNVFIERYSLDGEDYSFVITNNPVEHQEFYAGAAFNVDMTIKSSDDFSKRAENFIEALNMDERFKKFHHLNWSSPELLYFVIS
jgi:CRISPR/Cas system CSM-associated protein Csm3 (group 7 of RAMP superfamily)